MTNKKLSLYYLEVFQPRQVGICACFYPSLSSIFSLRKPMNRHIFLPTPFRGTPTNSTLNFVLRIHHKAQSRKELLILVYDNSGTHTKSFPLLHSIRFLQLAPRTVLHMNYPTRTPNTLEVDLPWDYYTATRKGLESPWELEDTMPQRGIIPHTAKLCFRSDI